MSNLNSEAKNKALRLLKYLTELTRIRSPIVRDIGEYNHIIWIFEIPKDMDHCYTRAWGENKEYDSEDIWIEISKYDEPILDGIPAICEQWVDETTLYNLDEIPELLSSIFQQVDMIDPKAHDDDNESSLFISESRTLKLEDNPDVSLAWEQFVDSKWFPWRDKYQKWQVVQEVYAKLFKVYQEQQKLGEEYELVIGFGLLTWLTPSGHKVRRHLITTKVLLNFDPKVGKFVIVPPPEGAQLVEEYDMIDIEDQPPNIRQLFQEALLLTDNNPWNISSIDTVLKSVTNSLADLGQGEYRCNVEPSRDSAKAKPIVEYAPAIILRKRSVRGLEQALQSIGEQIEAGSDVPEEFLSLCEEEINGQNDYLNDTSNKHVDLGQIFFPKPTNREQEAIVGKLESSTGVVMQGPPGTGKSHTIANLICHLLACGQRVLVTAKTPRALQVLHDQLPEQIRPLCINLLGSGIDEQNSLKASISSILTKQSDWNDQRADGRIHELEESIHQLKKEKAEIDYKLKSIRESETVEHNIIEGAYSGTASKIVLRLREESNQFSWFNDNIFYDQVLPLNFNEINFLIEGLNLLENELTLGLGLMIPSPESDLPSPDYFKELVSLETDAKSSLSSDQSLLDAPLGERLRLAESRNIQELLKTVTKLKDATGNIKRRPMPWIEKAVHDILTDNDTPWKDLLRIHSENLKGLKERVEKVNHVNLTAPPNIHRKKLLLDAKNLKKYLDEGGKIGWWIFRPKSIREKKYITEKVQINSYECKDIESLETLIECLEVRETIDYCWKLWEGKAERKNGILILQVGELEELNEALNKVVELYDVLEFAKESVRNINGLGEPAWHDESSVQRLIDTCSAIIAMNRYKSVHSDINQYVTCVQLLVNQLSIHPKVNDILSALENRDIDSYDDNFKCLRQLKDQSDRVKISKNLIDRLSEHAPNLSKEILESPNDEKWKTRLKNLHHAWTWARGNSWIINFLAKEDEHSSERQRVKLESKINNCIAELCAIRAWKFCFKRMQETHRSHLMAWQQAMAKLGKATGKHAPTHRRNAQRHLNECKDAVPAWVMPLHRIYETVNPEPGIFDVIIVDEASQCGFESLPLTYLCKRLLVVGDDQQISPEAPGVSVESVQGLIKSYLHDFEHRDSFDLETSLFHHATRRFDRNRIVLREHFRCVPEIIRFSNDLCYSATPLIPLRQYPPNRLEPLMRVHVTNGYREGSSNHAVNRSEAERIIDVIADCCDDKRYDGKTMGVISLQGDAQASLIESMLLERLGAEEIVQRRIICGNPYSFQGDERDIIFLSLVAARNVRIGALTKEADKRRFNVAASRARDQMWLFHSIDRGDLNESCMRRRLLEYFLDPNSQVNYALGQDIEELRLHAYKANRKIELPPEPYESWFELDVALQIASSGYRVIPQYSFAGKRIDLVVEGEKSKLAVECDGDRWHGPEHYELDMERQRMLERCGWRFYRIRESFYYSNPRETLNGLFEELEALGIGVIGKDLILSNELQQRIKENINNQIVVEPGEVEFDSELDSSEVNDRANIKLALAMKPVQLRKIIVDTLKERPNFSCVKDALHRFVLARMKVRTRGKPRELFQRKISRILNQMEREREIKVYKSKNVRVQLMQ